VIGIDYRSFEITSQEGKTMKKAVFIIPVLLIAALTLFGCSRGYERQATAGDVKVTLTADRYPLVKGDNTITIKIADPAGKSVSDAVVSVRYYMPAMPGMPPMDFNTQAVLKGDKYSFSANIPMEGGWKADVSVARPGTPAAATTFNLDAR
jgi:hypothetical protein